MNRVFETAINRSDSNSFESHFIRQNVGFQLLSQAANFAMDAQTGIWDFAVELKSLYSAGVTINEIRWMIAKGLVDHGVETSICGDEFRTFAQGNGFKFAPSTCFVLSPKGIELADQLHSVRSRSPERSTDPKPKPNSKTPGQNSGCPDSDKCLSQLSNETPTWDRKRRELRIADLVVKRFRVPAPNQELILEAFEEENWPSHIHDPLPYVVNIDPQTRLHDAINRLNGKQKNCLIRFRGNGLGNGITWSHRKNGIECRNE